MKVFRERCGLETRLWLTRGLCLGLVVFVSLTTSRADDGLSSSDPARPDHWQWWHGIWFRKDGNPRYASGAGNLTRNHQKRLEVRPPLCAPEFGYFQPCWRQLPVSQRCFTCETVPADYAVPVHAHSPLSLPPTPAAGDIVPRVPSVPPVVPAPSIEPPTGVGHTAPSGY